MTQIKVKVGDDILVTWSTEYGFAVQNGTDYTIEVEEVESRQQLVDVPVLSAADLGRIARENRAAQAPRLGLVPDSGSDPDGDEPNYLEGVPTKEEALAPKKCGACNHPMHEDNACGIPTRVGSVVIECDCSTAFEVNA